MATKTDVREGDVGTEIIIDIGVDISASASQLIYYEKPDGVTGIWTAALFETQKVRYVVQAGDLDTVGVWKLQAVVEYGTGDKWHSVKTEFTVNPIIDVV